MTTDTTPYTTNEAEACDMGIVSRGRLMATAAALEEAMRQLGEERAEHAASVQDATGQILELQRRCDAERARAERAEAQVAALREALVSALRKWDVHGGPHLAAENCGREPGTCVCGLHELEELATEMP